MRRRVGLLAVLIALGATSDAADAAWLQCVASGKTAAGVQTAYLTSVTPVSAGHNRQPNFFQQRLQRYIATQYPDTSGLTVNCTDDADQLQANNRYESLYSETARRIGWENTHVILPADWLTKDWLETSEPSP